MIGIYAFVILWKDTVGILQPALSGGSVKLMIFFKPQKINYNDNYFAVGHRYVLILKEIPISAMMY